MATQEKIKLVAVGDGWGVGKTCLLIAFSEDRFPVSENGGTVFENYVADIDYEGKSVEIALWDTSGAEDYDRLRPLSYPAKDCDTDVLLICYSIVGPDTLDNVAEKVICSHSSFPSTYFTLYDITDHLISSMPAHTTRHHHPRFYIVGSGSETLLSWRAIYLGGLQIRSLGRPISHSERKCKYVDV